MTEENRQTKKINGKARECYKYWLAVVYPESDPKPDWSKFRAQGVKYMVSPLHDRDAFEFDETDVDGKTGEVIYQHVAGEIKKAHWHVLIEYRNTTTNNNIAKLLEPLNTKIFQPCLHPGSQYAYFWHDPNNPGAEGKETYDRDDIQEINGFNHMDHYEPTATENQAVLWELLALVKIRRYRNVIDLMDDQTLTPEQRLYIEKKMNNVRALLMEVRTKVAQMKEEEEKENEKRKAGQH